MLTLRDVLFTAPQILLARDPVEVLAGALARQPGRPVLVADDDGVLAGVLTEHDVVRAEGPATSCRSLLGPPPRTADADTPLDRFLQDVEGVGEVPVVAIDAGHPVGVVTPTDLARLAQHLLPRDLSVGEVAHPSSWCEVDGMLGPAATLARMKVQGAEYAVVLRGPLALGAVRRDDLAHMRGGRETRVGAFVARTAFSARRSEPLWRVAHDLVRARARGLPVTDVNGQVQGVITVNDIVEAMRQCLHTPRAPAVA